MKKLLLLGALALSTITYGQEVVSTQGDSYTNASGSIDFTIGEVVINTGTGGTNDLTQGFHQTNWNFCYQTYTKKKLFQKSIIF